MNDDSERIITEALARNFEARGERLVAAVFTDGREMGIILNFKDKDVPPELIRNVLTDLGLKLIRKAESMGADEGRSPSP